MPSLSPAADFAWLPQAYRPPVHEVDDYARYILVHEGRPLDSLPACRREAELQLWIWRAEHHRRSPGRPGPGLSPARQAAASERVHRLQAAPAG